MLYASAVQLPVLDVRRNFGLISWLSIVMVIVSALVIGAVVHALFPSISFALATALGAVVSPTDAVAATAIGHRVGLPPRLMTVLEGESLVNDASALVVLRTAVAALAVTSHFSLGHTALDFAWAVVGALITLVAFGISLPAVIAKMRFRPESSEDKRDSVQALMRQIGEAAIDAVGPLEEQTVDGEPLDPVVVSTLKDRIVPRLVSGSRQLRETKADTREQMEILQRRYLDAMREALGTERSLGVYSSETYRQVEGFLDTIEQRFTTS